MANRVLHPLYHTWANMIQRCENPSRKDFKHWGGRGISVCERWRVTNPRGAGFRNFVADMGVRPEGKTLDRIDNNGNYSPENCRWATRQQQTLNSNFKPGLAKAIQAHSESQKRVTHCPRGHEYTPENTYTHNGCRACKFCKIALDRWRYHGKTRPIEEFLYPIGKPGRRAKGVAA